MDLDFRSATTGPVYEQGNTHIQTTKRTGRTIAEAQDRDVAYERKCDKNFQDVIAGELDGTPNSMCGRGDLTSEQIYQRAVDRLELSIEGVALDLARLDHSLHFHKDKLFDVISSLYRLHVQCGSMLSEIEKVAGRSYSAPTLRAETLELMALGGYSVDPLTGAEMCPFTHYREPVPRQPAPSPKVA